MEAIEIKDIGPIERVSIPIPPQGGVVVLRGPNGGGKSTAVAAVDALARGTDQLAARARHGAKRGTAEGLGATVSVGVSRSTRKGELAVEAFESRVDVAKLVDPGIKDPEAADRQRIATVCALARIAPDPARFAALATGNADSLFGDALEGDDLPTMAALARRALHSAALQREKDAERLSGSASALLATPAPADDLPSETEAQEQLEAAIATCAKVAAEIKSARATAERAEKARQELAALEAQGGVDVEALRNRDREMRDAVSAAREAMEKAAAEFEEARTERDRVAKELATAERRASDIEAARKAIDAAAAAAGPTSQDLQAAEDELDAARKRVAAVATAATIRRQRREGEETAERAAKLRADSERLRDAARRTDDVMAEHLAAVMPQGLRVSAGRLVVSRDGRDVPFAELSEGERWRIALDLAIQAMGGRGHGIIPIEQAAWEGLDANARRAIAAHAQEWGVVILTAEADHDEVGPLRAEVYGAAPAAEARADA